MSDKSGNEIHEAFMKGYFKGKQDILNEIEMFVDAQDDEIIKQKEAHE